MAGHRLQELKDWTKQVEKRGAFVGGIPELFERAHRMCHQGATPERIAEDVALYERGKKALDAGLEPDGDFIPSAVLLLLDVLEEVNCRERKYKALQQGGLAHGSSPLLA